MLSLNIGAQKVMNIKLTDGSVVKYPVSQVEQITFDEPMLVGNAVDLGLPSGTLWSDINVGATKPEENGNYYGWGETVTHDTYSWENYQLWDYDNDQWISWGEDTLCFSMSDADVAHVKWGGDWHTPTQAQFQELVDNCTWTEDTKNDVKGYTVTGPNGNTIFFPLNGVWTDQQQLVGTVGNYWSSTRVQQWEYQYLGYALWISPDEDPEEAIGADATGYRYYGYGVRPVQGNIVETPELQSVDLGLPSGTKWANMNVGATAPEEAGTYFAWGETAPKDTYTKENYAYYDADADSCISLGVSIQGTEYDAATAIMGSDWQMPTFDQMRELLDSCTWTYTTQNNVQGYIVTGTNGNSIFIPSVGTKANDYVSGSGQSAYYWTGDAPEGHAGFAWQLSGYQEYTSIVSGHPYYGCPVRAVAK
jgi:hypothetical protein